MNKARRSKAALRETEERYRTVVEDQTEIISRFKADGTLTFVNDVFCRFFGRTRADLLHSTWRPRAEPEDLLIIEERLRALSPSNPVVVIENRVHTGSGDARWMQFVNRAFFDTAGRLVEVQSVGRDITERKRAEAALRGTQEQLRALADRLQAVREEERIRIARELHDELGQALTAMQIDLMWLDGRLRRARPADLPALRDKIAALVPVTERLIEATQRMSSTLRPAMLNDLGLIAAVEWLAADFASRTGLVCSTTLPSEDIGLDQSRDVALFRIVQEALTNVIRHAHATRVEVRLRVADDELLMDVQDDGRGIAPEEIVAPRSLGVLSMRERAAVLGGTVDIQGEPSRGTTVRVRMPSAISASS